MPPTANSIATAVLSTFHALPRKYKPRPRDDGTIEWIPLSGLVFEDAQGGVECVALGYSIHAFFVYTRINRGVG